MADPAPAAIPAAEYRRQVWAREFGAAAPEGPTFEDSGAFLSRVEAQPTQADLVDELLPFDGIGVWHGRPRSMKSLGAAETCLAVATHTPAFGSRRFATHSGDESVGYLTDEDGERLFAFRLRLMLRGRGLEVAPPLLKLCIRPGWNLEDREDQTAMLRAVEAMTPPPVLLCIDPARASMPSLDKGPADAAPAIRFLRQILRETSVRTLLLPHHDTKPMRDGKDERARPERASGGAVFSIADAPINFERVSERTCFAVPAHFKGGADPAPFRIHFESGTPEGEGFKDFIRARAEDTNEQREATVRATDRVLAALAGGEWLGTAAIVEAAGARRAAVLAALAQLHAQGQVERREEGRAHAFRRA